MQKRPTHKLELGVSERKSEWKRKLSSHHDHHHHPHHQGSKNLNMQAGPNAQAVLRHTQGTLGTNLDASSLSS